MGIQINGNTNNINAGIGSLSIEDINELDIAGVATAANFKTGVSNLHDVGLTLSGGQIDVGSNIKIGTAGVITATSFVGSGANLTGISGGLSNIVEDTSPQLGGNLDVNTKNILFGDSVSAGSDDTLIFGAGGDLLIFSDTTNGVLRNPNGRCYIQSNTGINLTKNGNTETLAIFNADGAVELYHNNNKKLETASYGAVTTGTFQATGNIEVFDNGKFIAGTGADLQIFHDGGDNHIDSVSNAHKLKIQAEANIELRRAGANEVMAVFSPNGAVELYHDNVKRFETTANGVEVSAGRLDVGSVQLSGAGLACADGDIVRFGNHDDLQVQHTGSHTNLVHNGTGNLNIHAQTGAMNIMHHHYANITTTGSGPEIGDTRHLRWASGNRYWTGEFDNKIQYHANNMYNQYTTNWIARNASGSNTFQVDSSGNFSSDVRKKENITTVTDALAKVSQLRGVEFKWKELHGGKEDMGLIAQEVETVLPKLIKDSPDPIGAAKENEDGTPMKMMNYNGLFSVMVEAIKDLKTKVETLETKVAALEGS